ncbi:N-acetylmuramoyl-L-alanine amidase [Echinicola marina]|uniref:N-acetylmuramoyl-L-alanine amidase n=1 Tax=Echinicola marina TaxID=2859768 RepID=UPI001CF71696|nr:N-acetylmuramoyl-L-alanine amidase [Echinicola marina]UCS95336.1 N-acetylmuramoyl-L-alanine amidase [Echinicola marina]
MKTIHCLGLILILTSITIACTPNPYKSINKQHKKQVKETAQNILEIPKAGEEGDTTNVTDLWVGTTNFSIRRPNFVIIHHTAQDSLEQTIRTFTLPRAQVSSHYVVSKDGTIVQMLNDYLRSWHAGRGKWGHDTDLNSSSIGIELDNNGSEPFTPAQIESLLSLLKRLKNDYHIPTANFIGHADIAPARKVDPSAYFPWKRLAEQGYGLWYDDHMVTEMGIPNENGEYKIEKIMLEPVPSHFNPKEALRIIGYDVSDYKAAIRAFKIHFIQKDLETALDDNDLRILHNLYKKYL